MDPIDVAFSISETWYLELMQERIKDKRTGDDADDSTHVPLIRLPDGTMYGHRGEFDFIDNKVDEKTGTVLVRARFPNPDLLLLPGQFVTVVIERKEAKDAVVIPQAAVLTDQGGAYVLTVDGQDKVESRRIRTGQRFGPDLVVSEGLKPGDRVVLYGVQKVRPGIKVTPELTEAPGNPMDKAATGSTMGEGDTAKAAAETTGDEVGARVGKGPGAPDAGASAGESSPDRVDAGDSTGEDKPE